MRTVLEILAGNPAIRPEHVDTLTALGGPDVRAKLCRGRAPLTPAQIDTLLEHGGRPALLDLIRFGRLPAERIPEDDPWALLAAVNRPDAPAHTVGWLTTDPAPAVRRGLAEYIGHAYDFAGSTLTDERYGALLTLSQDPDCSVAAATVRLLEQPEAPGRPPARHHRERTEACIRTELAGCTTDPEVLRDLLAVDGPAPLTACPHHPDPVTALLGLRRTALGNQLSPADAVEAVLTATWPELAAPAAGYRGGLRAETHERLAALGDPRVTSGLTTNQAAPTELIRRLCDAEDGRWRDQVLRNAAVPVDLLVRETLAGHWVSVGFHHDVAGITALADHPDPRVRMVVLGLHGLPAEVVVRLTEDPDPAVAVRAVVESGDPDRFHAAARRYGPSGYLRLADSLCCPTDLLVGIADDPDSPLEAVLSAAFHRDATREVVAAGLRNRPGPEMDEAVLDCSDASPEQLYAAVRRAGPDLLPLAAEHEQLPPRAVDLILEAVLGPAVAADRITEL